MTAEIAILNKTAVALAADSAVTISVGTDQRKVYDSEDKLFELSCNDPIGVMINGNMHFMEAPLPVIIKRYRTTAKRHQRVPDAADAFLTYLLELGAKSPDEVQKRDLRAAINPIWGIIKRRFEMKLPERLSTPFPADMDPNELGSYFRNLRHSVFLEQVAAVHRLIDGFEDTEAYGEKRNPAGIIRSVLEELSDEHDFGPFGEEGAQRLAALAKVALGKRVPWSPKTGIVVAGFGADDLFPTLVSFELYGMVRGQLRLFRTHEIDIDRDGTRSKILPFAQKEMVDRFLYGLDEDIQRRITDFCKNSIPEIRERVMDRLVMDDADRDAMVNDIEEAESAFIDALREKTFDVIRSDSEREMNDMIEFMPKPEMARMAEALVNLTSIKRRVSHGMETVGGPIDCAVISQAEGFVWVKRKHYFPHELNSRYFERMRRSTTDTEGA